MQGGSNVVLLARRVEALSKVAADCAAAHKEAGHQLGGKFATVQLDVSDRQQIANLWSRIPEDLRDVDILGLFFFRVMQSYQWAYKLEFQVNNAGYVLGVEHVGNIAEADIEGMFATNVFGLIAMTQLLIKGDFIHLTGSFFLISQQTLRREKLVM
jgi:3-hydroxy acid dehydrogenase/malonic semialdehyde reductase